MPTSTVCKLPDASLDVIPRWKIVKAFCFVIVSDNLLKITSNHNLLTDAINMAQNSE